MERVLIYCFASLFLMIWLAYSRAGKREKAWGESLFRLVPPMAVTAIMVLDDRFSTDGMPASLLAADMLYLDALVLHGVRFISEKGRVSVPFLLLALYGAHSPLQAILSGSIQACSWSWFQGLCCHIPLLRKSSGFFLQGA